MTPKSKGSDSSSFAPSATVIGESGESPTVSLKTQPPFSGAETENVYDFPASRPAVTSAAVHAAADASDAPCAAETIFREPAETSPDSSRFTRLNTAAPLTASDWPAAKRRQPADTASPTESPTSPTAEGSPANATLAPLVTISSDVALAPSAKTSVPPATTMRETEVASPRSVFTPEPVRINLPSTPSALTTLCGMAISKSESTMSPLGPAARRDSPDTNKLVAV